MESRSSSSRRLPDPKPSARPPRRFRRPPAIAAMRYVGTERLRPGSPRVRPLQSPRPANRWHRRVAPAPAVAERDRQSPAAARIAAVRRGPGLRFRSIVTAFQRETAKAGLRASTVDVVHVKAFQPAVALISEALI
jgi:hypothetical protein